MALFARIVKSAEGMEVNIKGWRRHPVPGRGRRGRGMYEGRPDGYVNSSRPGKPPRTTPVGTQTED